VTELLTTDATQVSPGNPVKILNWGGPSELLGQVRVVSRAGFVKASALGVDEERTEVIADLAQIPDRILEHLSHNFHAELRIQTHQVEDALKVPLGALVRQGESWAVYKVLNQRAKLVVIDIGLRNIEEARVHSGVAVDDRIVIYPGERVKDGVRLEFDSSKHPK
jgi:HlyD family secretion protein